MMFLRNKKNVLLLILSFSVALFTCSRKTFIFNNPDDRLIGNSFITKPVKGDSKAQSFHPFYYDNESLNDFFSRVTLNESMLAYDSVMEYITSFERQRFILINRESYNYLTIPRMFNMMDLYFNAGYNTKDSTKTMIAFGQSYVKNILNFGGANVLEYKLRGVSDKEPHFMFIFLKLTTKEEIPHKDCSGYVLFSDGMDWKEIKNKNYSIPLFIQNTEKNNGSVYVPLHFDGDRFIPTGHFKSVDRIDSTTVILLPNYYN